MKHAIKGLPPNKNEGMVFIVMFINGVDLLKKKDEKTVTKHLQYVFDANTHHLSHKYTFDDFGSLFLKLDAKNQSSLLYDFGFDENFLRLPEIKNWEELGKEAGLVFKDTFDMEDIRLIGKTWFNEWDLYPHAMVWVRRFLLHCSRTIVDSEYTGEKFGNYTNWAAYYLQLGLDKRKEFTKFLINYN